MNSIQDRHSCMVKALTKRGEDIMSEMTPEKANLDHLAMGIAGEAGEVVDAVKRHTKYNKELQRQQHPDPDCEHAMSTKFAVVYTDDGPGGPCGQDCVTTSDHTRVYLFNTEEEARDFLIKKPIPRRKKSKATLCYPEGHNCHTYANGVFQ